MKLICIDLDIPLPAIPPCTTGEQWVLIRLHGRPLGMVYPPKRGCAPAELARLVLEQQGWSVAQHLAGDDPAAASSVADLAALPRACPRAPAASTLSVTVAVCTRNRASRLGDCLAALDALDYPAHLLDLVVVDNAPSDDSTRDVVGRYPRIRYIREPRPGLDWARNAAVRSSRADVVAYTDDDVCVDRGWVRAIAAAFDEEPHAMCVTGLVVPDELDTRAQVLFETYGGFGRGYQRNVYRVDIEKGESAAQLYGGTGRFGTGANMAFRRAFFDAEGLFDPALDVGTPSNGGGDLEMFFRVLKTGHALVYEPAALVRHRHRRTYDELKRQIANNGIGFYAYLVRTAQAYPDERGAIVRLGIWWLWWWNVRRVLKAIVRPGPLPLGLMLAELKGSFIGLRRYAAARRHAAAVLRQFGQPCQPVAGIR
jgi:glycosyltransferase involved in cell wall biosynthesis